MISEVVNRVASRVVSDYRSPHLAPHWGDFVLIEGLLDVWQASDNVTYLDCARAILDSYVERGPDWGAIIWQWAGLGLPALRLHRITGSQRYGQFGLAIADRLRNRTQKTKDGGIITHRERAQIWIDILHFACPTFSQVALYTGDQTYLDAATEQFRIYVSHLLDETSGLFYHMWDEETGQHSPCLWARGNGWLTLACVETLAQLPDTHPERQYLSDVLTRQVEAICQYQDPSGHWHTIIDRPDSYIETSAAEIFSLAIVRGIRLGLLERKWLLPAYAGWRALQDKASHDGLIFGVSAGTPPGDFDNYQRIPLGVQTYGTGLFLQLGVEMSGV